MHVLTETKEVLFLTEGEAYDHIQEMKDQYSVESASVKYKKETKSKAEHYIVTVKVRLQNADELVSMVD